MLSEEEKKAIERLSNGEKIELISLIRVFKREGIENFVITRKEYIRTVLNLITKLQKEKEEKDKQINNAINEVENIRQYFSEDLQPEFIRVLEILKNKKVIDW